MKKTIIFFLLIISLTGCKKDEDEQLNCIQLTTINDWTTIDFKADYTIQLPEGFEGPGMVGFEGNTFYKNSTDDKIILGYMYCGPLWCEDFGDTLQTPVPDNIQVMGNFDYLITLNKKEYFCQDSEITGVLYYSTDDITKSRLYWKDNGYLKQALELEFYLSELETVKSIIGTIERK